MGEDHAHRHSHAPRRAAGEPAARASAIERAAAEGAPASAGAFTAGEAKQARRLTLVLSLIACFFVLELAGAIAAGSVVLQADAIHLLMDVFALAMSVLAMRVAVRKPTARFTFGLRRAEPVAAIFNAGLVLVATAEIVHEGIEALGGAATPKAGLMMVVASGALVVNGVSAWLLHDALKHGQHGHGHGHAHGGGHEHDHHHDHESPSQEEGAGRVRAKHAGHSLNLRGAWLHLAGDTLGSLAALVAALVIHFGGPSKVDPLASFLVASILVFGALRLIRDATLVLLEAAPQHLPVNAVREVILSEPEVSSIHDLHVWTLGAGHDAITAHVHATRDDKTLAARLSRRLRDDFHVEYVTVQVDFDEPCVASATARGPEG